MAGSLIFLPESVMCAKGLLPYCLEEVSKRRGARVRLQKLHDAIAALAPRYHGLETVFDTYLVAHIFRESRVRRDAIAYLGAHWFDPAAREAHFPGQPVAQIYAQGVLKAVQLSLQGRRPIPISAWWIVDAKDVKLLTLADVNEAGVTIGGRVTLLILTPRPRGDGPTSKNPILGDTAEAWVSQQQGSEVKTYRVRDLV